MKMKIAITLRSLIVTGALGVCALAGTASLSQTTPMTPQERAAADLIREWFAAWEAKDPAKVASLLDENVEFRPTPAEPMQIGRATFLKQFRRVLEAGPREDVTVVYAVGGPTGTAVLTKRVDSLTLDGRTLVVPLAAFFRVDHGKIQEFLDIPLRVPGGARQGARGVEGPPPKGAE